MSISQIPAKEELSRGFVDAEVPVTLHWSMYCCMNPDREESDSSSNE
jgi:hypothetical protein